MTNTIARYLTTVLSAIIMVVDVYSTDIAGIVDPYPDESIENIREHVATLNAAAVQAFGNIQAAQVALNQGSHFWNEHPNLLDELEGNPDEVQQTIYAIGLSLGYDLQTLDQTVKDNVNQSMEILDEAFTIAGHHEYIEDGSIQADLSGLVHYAQMPESANKNKLAASFTQALFLGTLQESLFFIDQYKINSENGTPFIMCLDQDQVPQEEIANILPHVVDTLPMRYNRALLITDDNRRFLRALTEQPNHEITTVLIQIVEMYPTSKALTKALNKLQEAVNRTFSEEGANEVIHDFLPPVAHVPQTPFTYIHPLTPMDEEDSPAVLPTAVAENHNINELSQSSNVENINASTLSTTNDDETEQNPIYQTQSSGMGNTNL